MSRVEVHHNRYDRRNIECMELVYGDGFLAPGGAAEVARIVERIDLRHRDVLDVGCGLGGAVVALARDLHARHVTGVDIEPAVLERARELVNGAGVSGVVSLRQVEPGPLPFEESSFDVVYLNSVSCHLEHLDTFFAELLRVLRRGGHLVGSEWFVGEDDDAFSVWDTFLRERGLNFHFVAREAFAKTLTCTGFEFVEIIDRSDTVGELGARDLDRVRGPLRARLTEALGKQGYAGLVRWTRTRADALRNKGALRGHFQATKTTTR